MRCRFAFSQTSDGRLLVTMESHWGFPADQEGKFCACAIDDENTFIHRLVLASLAKEETVELIASILLVVSGRISSPRWISATVSDLQLTALGMRTEREEKLEKNLQHPMGFAGEEDLARVFMAAPTPVGMMSGPEHIVTFVNVAFLQILGRSEGDILGKPIREALSDLEGQPFFTLLDKVYATGEQYVGVEVPARVYNGSIGAMREAYFDFVYHPVRNSAGEVCGILCQSTEVTERVLEKHVRESREEQLYRQWAELDAIYRTSPVGMCLISAKDYSILRINEIKAQILGGPADELIGKKMTEIYPEHYFIPDTYEEVIRTKSAMNFELSMDLPAAPGEVRTWLWNLNPVLDATGNVEAIATITLEITDRPAAIKAFLGSTVGAAP